MTAEQQAQWSEGERNLYGALRKEREKRKEKSKELNELRAEVNELKTKLTNPPGQPAPTTPQPPPATGDMLVDCVTPEQVDARAMQAAAMQADAQHLQTVLAREGREAVVQLLAEGGMEKINGVALADVNDRQLSDWLASVHKGALLVTTGAESRKRYLYNQTSSWNEAVKLIPELKDAKNPRAQKFVAIVNGNPFLKQQGPNWPIIAAKYLLGDEAVATPGARPNGAAAPAAQPAPVPPAPAARPLPGAPRTATGSLPQPDEYEKAAERVRNGTATLADIQFMATAGVNALSAPAR